MTVKADFSGPMKLDVGIMAHNEAGGIARFITQLSEQSIFAADDVDTRLALVANGCTDDTAAIARRTIAGLPTAFSSRIEVVELKKGGKSRSMNHYLRHLAREDADVIGFMDADIDLPQKETMLIMARALRDRPDLRVFVSNALSDVTFHSLDVGPLARLMASGSGSSVDPKKVICGQLFMLRGEFGRKPGLPADLPVDDGYIRIMALTDFLSAPPNADLIDGDPEAYHVFPTSPRDRTIPAVLKHNVRIMVGTAINYALIQKFEREMHGADETAKILRDAGETDDWLERTMKEETPVFPHGFVPFRYATRRLTHGFRTKAWRRGPRAIILMVAGAGLDLATYVGASVRMMKNRGVGHW
jgi:hypothetical protein